MYANFINKSVLTNLANKLAEKILVWFHELLTIPF